jgi:hypothetical protein
MTKEEVLIQRLREEATHELNHQTIALLLEAAQALASPAQPEPVAHRQGFWCADLTCKKCYSAEFRLKHATPPATPVQPEQEPSQREFENWLRSKWTAGYTCQKLEGRYTDKAAQSFWECWQAATVPPAAQQEPVQELVPETLQQQLEKAEAALYSANADIRRIKQTILRQL